jgi:hypothetical protein
MVQRTGATVIVVHHLTKNAAPSNFQQVRETVRGSGVFLDRPRVVLGCFRRDDTTIVGRLKSNLPPNFAIKPAIHLRRDPITLRHTVRQQDGPAAGPSGQTGALDQLVLDAVRRLLAAGQKITRAGANELWEKHVPELDGIGRNRIRSIVDQLLAEGRLTTGQHGIALPSA